MSLFFGRATTWRVLASLERGGEWWDMDVARMCLRPSQKEGRMHSVALVVSEKTTPPNLTPPEAGFNRVNKDPGRSADAAAVAHVLQGFNCECNFSQPNRLMCTRHVTTKLPLGSIRVPDLLLTPTLHRSFVAASNLDHVPTT